MRRVSALFDAPVPAQRAVEALLQSGVDLADVWTVPCLPLAQGRLTRTLAPPTDLAALRRALEAREMPEERRELLVDGVRRGAILVMVEVPTLSAELAAGLLDAAGAADPAELQSLWAAYRATTYDWQKLDAPDVEPPRPPRAPRVERRRTERPS